MCLDSENQIIYVIGRYLTQDTRTSLFTITVPVSNTHTVSHVLLSLSLPPLLDRVISIVTVFKLVSGRSYRLTRTLTGDQGYCTIIKSRLIQLIRRYTCLVDELLQGSRM